MCTRVRAARFAEIVLCARVLGTLTAQRHAFQKFTAQRFEQRLVLAYHGAL